MTITTPLPPLFFDAKADAVIAYATWLASDDSSGTPAEGSALADVVISATHLFDALAYEASFDIGEAQPPKIIGPSLSPHLAQLLSDTDTIRQADGVVEITRDHLRRAIGDMCRHHGIDLAILDEVRGRIGREAPTCLGITSLRHRDLPPNVVP